VLIRGLHGQGLLAWAAPQAEKMSSDPPPPGPPPGSFGASPAPPRPGSGSGSARSRNGASYPAGSSSATDLAAAPQAGALPRSSSQGSIRPPSGGSLGPRNPSREALAPLPPGSPVLPAGAGAIDTTPRSAGNAAGRARLEPLSRPGSGQGSRPGSGGGSRQAGGAIPPLDLGTGGATPSRVPPVPAPHPGADARKASDAIADKLSDAPTQRGPVKWVPHTHSNPKHAKFCFICLHGKLEGDKDGDGEEKMKAKMDEDELPSSVDMKELSYLLPAGSERFARTNADYEQDNLSALWFRDVSDSIYEESIRGMLAQQNAVIAQGGDIGIIDDKEDDADRALLQKIFTLSDEEQDGVNKKMTSLGLWCQAQEVRLQDVMPPPRERIEMPECDPPTEVQKVLLEYQPLIDLTQLKGETASAVRETIRQADAVIGDEKAAEKGETFKASSLPKPRTHPDMPDFKILPYPLSVNDIPPYEFTNPDDLQRQPVEYPLDPFPRAFLHLVNFDENIMPQFDNNVSFGETVTIAPGPARDHLWLSKTRSIFADNNEDLDEQSVVFGNVPSRPRIRQSMIDEPYQPPFDLVRGPTGHRELKIRGIWDPELLSPSGDMVPPIRDRGTDLYREPEFEHPTLPIWSRDLAPMKDRKDKVKDMCNVVPVRSFARFKPKKVSVAIPDFLWSLAREDASGQSLWTVVEQRHNIPIHLREEEERYAEEQRQIAEQEADAIRKTMDAEAEAFRRMESEGSDYDPDKPADPDKEFVGGLGGTQLPIDGKQGSAGATQMPAGGLGGEPPDRNVEDHTDGMPSMDVEAPEPPSLAPFSEPLMPVSSSAGARYDAAAESSSAAATGTSAQRPITPFNDAATRQPPPTSTGEIVQSSTRGPNGTEQITELKIHEGRIREMLDPEKGRSIESLLTDEKFVDTIAEKIAARMGGGGSTFNPGPPGMGSPSGGVLGGRSTAPNVGRGAHKIRPDPPSFAEPSDQASRAELPRALQGGGPAKSGGVHGTQKATTVNDVNSFTMEKMRGECYVRLLVKPESNAARKDPIPYKGDTMPPDTTLVMGGGRPNLRMPPKPPQMNDDGDLVQDDEFAEFEKDDSIVFSFVRHNRYESLEALIASDTAVLLSKDESGNNLLHVACQNNSRRIAKLLLKAGINVNEQNKSGNTPLHYCYQYGFEPMCEYLVAHNADDSIANHANFLPAQGLGRDDNVGDSQQQMNSAAGQGM